MLLLAILLLILFEAPVAARSAETILFGDAAGADWRTSTAEEEDGSLLLAQMRAFLQQPGEPVASALAACSEQIEPPPRRQGLSLAASLRRTAFWPQVWRAACQHGVSPALLDSLVIAESAYNPGVTSRAGAGGLAQLMPGTARMLGVADRYDPAENLHGGARYLRKMIDRFPSLELALAAYNAGPGAVERAGRIPRNGETPDYVRRVLRLLGEAGAPGAAAPSLRRALLIRWDGITD